MTVKQKNQHPNDILNRYDKMAMDHKSFHDSYIKAVFSKSDADKWLECHMKSNIENSFNLIKLLSEKKK